MFLKETFQNIHYFCFKNEKVNKSKNCVQRSLIYVLLLFGLFQFIQVFVF